MKRRSVLSLLILFLTIIFYSNGGAMSIFGGGSESEVMMMSPFHGKLLFNGEPAKNARLTLRLIWNRDDIEELEFYSDDEGFVDIPEQVRMKKRKKLAQATIDQEMEVLYNNESFFIWDLGKITSDKNAEFGGTPKNIVCELTEELTPANDGTVVRSTNCRWDLITDSEVQ